MSKNKIPIKDCYKRLKISKSTLYSRLKKLDIKPLKIGKNSYLSDDDLDRLDKYNPTKDKPDTQDKELKQLQAIIEEKNKKIEALNREVGQWQGRAKTLEEQNEKLLILEAPKKPSYKS